MDETIEIPNPTFVEEFGGRLRKDREALLHTLALTDDELVTMEAHQAGDRVDDAATEVVGAILSRLQDQQRYELDEVDEALVRLEYGTFGLCEGCGQQVPLSRLRAMPTARYCLACQKKVETQ
jgi:RNA polymerase-binding protein DksA